MATSPLRLEEVIYERVHVEARKAFNKDGDHGQRINTQMGFGQNLEDSGLWRVELEVKVLPDDDEPEPPYDIDIRCVGIFRVHQDFPEDRAGKLVAVTGTSILYSGLRDFVMTISGRGPWGAVMLPTTSFVDIEPATDEENTVRDSETSLDEKIMDALREHGPLAAAALGPLVFPVGAVAAVVGGSVLKKTLADLAGAGTVEKTGRGRGTKYGLAENRTPEEDS